MRHVTATVRGDGFSVKVQSKVNALSIVGARAVAAAAVATTSAARAAYAGHKAGAKRAAPARQRRSAELASAGQDGNPVGA